MTDQMTDQTRMLIESLSEKLKRRSLRLCTAESCTGGMISALCTSLAGSSEWFNGAVVSYDNSVKTGLLRVPAHILKEYGAVSPQCAEAMARGALEACNADCAVSTTGIAGPGGGSAAKPVGTVVIGLALPGDLSGTGPLDAGSEGFCICSATRRFDGGRAAVRLSAALEALRLLNERLPA